MRARRPAALNASWKASSLAVFLLLLVTSDGLKVPESPRGVLIITLDTTRADVLPTYGGANLETPALDRLARVGIVFEQATSPAPLTLPAHCSLFTGLLPTHHGVRDNVDAPLDDAQVTLAEALHSRGIRSAAFVASAVVAARRGLAQGFDVYSDSHHTSPRFRRPANSVVDEAIAWIDRQGAAPFFTWLHLYDAHGPYSLPEPYRTMYADAPYLGAIAFMDSQIQRLLHELERRHLAEHTLLVIAGDHGESLGDHNEDGHGILLYQSTVRVPLIIRMPGVAPKRLTDVVRLVDLMPTVLDALRIALPASDGVSLLPLMKGQIEHLDLEAYSESLYPRRFGWSELRALRAGRFKFVSAPRPELFDLEKDPEEQRNIHDERPDLAAAMAARLATMSAASVASRVGGAPEPDAETRVRLAALGYVSPARSSQDGRLAAPVDDPKDCIGVYNAIVRAYRASPQLGTEALDNRASTGRRVRPFDRPSSCSSGPLPSAVLSGTLAVAHEPVRQRARTPPKASR